MASILNICSRRIVGFSVSEHHDTELAYGALTMAIAVRGGDVRKVVLHSDGSEPPPGRSAPPVHGWAWPSRWAGPDRPWTTQPSSRSTPRWSSNYAGWSTPPPKPKPAAGSPNGSTNTTGTPGEAPALRAGHAQPDRPRTGRAHRQTPASRPPRSRRDHCPAITKTGQKNGHTTTIRSGEVSTVTDPIATPGSSSGRGGVGVQVGPGRARSRVRTAGRLCWSGVAAGSGRGRGRSAGRAPRAVGAAGSRPTSAGPGTNGGSRSGQLCEDGSP